MENQTLQLAIMGVITAILAVTGPVIMALIQNRHARRSKLEDYARADLLEARQVERAKVVAELLEKSNATTIKTALKTDIKLDVIHTLVNSEKTAAMQSHVATLRLHLITLQQLDGIKPSPVGQTEIAHVMKQIADVEAVLAERLATDQVVQKQLTLGILRSNQGEPPPAAAA